VLVITSGYSRMRWARMIPFTHRAGLIAGHWQLSSALSAVLRQLVWANEGAVGLLEGAGGNRALHR